MHINVSATRSWKAQPDAVADTKEAADAADSNVDTDAGTDTDTAAGMATDTGTDTRTDKDTDSDTDADADIDLYVQQIRSLLFFFNFLFDSFTTQIGCG